MNAGLLYREATVQGASSVALVARLYEQAVEDLRKAVKALDGGNVEERTNRINHAILVIAYLQTQLNFEAGGQVAEKLRDFYDAVRDNLIQAQIQQSRHLLLQQITDLIEVRQAWIQVDQVERETTFSARNAFPAAGTGAADPAPRNWKG